MEIGEIIVKRRSKAKTLRPKLRRIVGVLSDPSIWTHRKTLEVIKPGGKSKELVSTYAFCSLETEELVLKNVVYALEKRLAEAKKALSDFQREVKEVDKHFPKY